MTRAYRQEYRILAIAPSTRGFGFAVLDNDKRLLDWAGKSVKGDKNSGCMKKVQQLIVQYQPEVIVLPDASAKGSRRSQRIRALCQQLIDAAGTQKIRVGSFSSLQVRQNLLGNSQVTKHELAQEITKEFPEELATRLPSKRKPWMSEDHRMDIFDAVALGLVYLCRRQKRSGENAEQ